MPSPYDSIKTLIHSEKGARLEADGCYQFWVDRRATKIDVKNAVEKIYKVKVASVNTVVMPGKMKRVRIQAGRQPDWKKAFVRVAEGHKIEIK